MKMEQPTLLERLQALELAQQRNNDARVTALEERVAFLERLLGASNSEAVRASRPAIVS